MKKGFLLLLLLFAALQSRAQESQSQYNFLRLPVSAHAAALGGDNVTIIEDDASLVFFNPALAASVSDMSIGLNYMSYMKGANYLSASFVKAASDKATWAVGAQYINYGTMKETDEYNRETGSFSAQDVALSGTFAYTLASKWVGGITAKMVYSSLGSYTSLAMGVDLGLNYYDPDHEWSISAVARNLGGELKAYDEDFGKMPLDVEVGVSKTLAMAPLRFSATLVDMTHYDYRFVNHLCLGADLLLSESIWIGAGYNFRRADEMKIQSSDSQSSHGAGLSLGAGVNLERFKLNVAYGKYHVSSSALMINVAYCL